MKLPLLILAMTFSMQSFPCDCGYNGPFLHVAKQTKLVVVIRVKNYFHPGELSHMPMAMRVEVLEVLKGKEERKSIIVWGDNGWLCRPYVSQFKKDSVYVLALNEENGKWEEEQENRKDYFVRSCGAFWLTADIVKRKVLGDINSTDKSSQSMTIEKLRSELSNDLPLTTASQNQSYRK